MQMRHAFAGVRSAVNHDAVTGCKQIELLRHRSRGEEQLAEQRFIGLGRIGQSRHHPLRHDQYVHRRLRIYIAKRQDLVIFPDDVRGNFAPDDFFKNCHAIFCAACHAMRKVDRALSLP